METADELIYFKKNNEIKKETHFFVVVVDEEMGSNLERSDY